jgi:hypothetical protein
MATGTKCAGKGKEDVNGYITSDSHAEVLARRSFVRWLAKCILALQDCPTLQLDHSFPLQKMKKDVINDRTSNRTSDIRSDTISHITSDNIIENSRTTPNTNPNPGDDSSKPYTTGAMGNISNPKPNPNMASFAVKEEWKFYLYVSDSPCGDASIYPRIKGDEAKCFTGAKLVRSLTLKDSSVITSHATSDISSIINSITSNSTSSISSDKNSNETSCCSWEREGTQELGCLRTKSGRSDIKEQNRTSSMSCSDKICRLGMG